MFIGWLHSCCCIPIFLGVTCWWSNYVNDHILLQSPNIKYIYIWISQAFGWLRFCWMKLPISPYLPSLLEQCQQLVGTSQKDMVGRQEFPLQTTEPPCKVYFFYKNKQIKRTEEQHTTSPIHIFIPDAWFCLYPTVSDDLVLTRPQASI